MAIRTQSILPFPISSIPDRLTPIFVTDDRVMATTTGGTLAAGAVRVNRIQSASFAMDTNVQEITEMGAQFRVGGVDDLGEVRIKLDWNAVGINNIAAIVGKVVSATAGATTTVGLTDFQTAKFDLLRLVAGPDNNVFGTLYCQDCVVDEYNVDLKEKGIVMEGIQARGPNAVFFPGYVLPKVYVATSTDVTNGYLTLTPIFGADEQVVQIYQPQNGQPPSYWQQNGANYFLKVEKVPGAVQANTPVRYFEYINATFQTAAAISSTAYITPSTFIPQLTTVGQKVTLEPPGAANTEVVTITAVASQVNTTSTAGATAGASVVITPVSMLGIFPGVTVQMANADGSAAETQPVASTTSSTFTVATLSSTKTANFTIKTKAPSFQANVTKTHAAATVMYPQLTAAQNNVGTCTYLNATNKLYTGDTLVAGDAYRLVFCSYNSDTLPTSIPSTTPDTVDRAGVHSRMVPVMINALVANRAQSVSFKFSLKRDHVQGVGENSIVYGVPAVPDVAVSIDVKENDLSLLSQLSTGSKNLTALGGTIQNDFQDLNYITRAELATAYPVSVNLYDPFSSGTVLCTYKTPQVVVKGIEYASTNKADNSVKINALDIVGNFTISYTAPQ